MLSLGGCFGTQLDVNLCRLFFGRHGIAYPPNIHITRLLIFLTKLYDMTKQSTEDIDADYQGQSKLQYQSLISTSELSGIGSYNCATCFIVIVGPIKEHVD